MNLTRRSFVGSIGASAAALSLNTIPAAEAQLVFMPADWHAAEFDKLLKSKARVRQVFDCQKIDNGDLFGPMKNSINGLHFGFGIPSDQIKVVAALRGQANLLNFDDSMWEKYKLGEYTGIDDPKTGKPATRNIFYPKKDGKITDQQDPKSIYQDYTIQALAERGLTLLSCHNATEHQVQGIVKKFALTTPVEDIVKDLQAHMLPGCISVPAMVSAIAMLQMDGNYAYTMG